MLNAECWPNVRLDVVSPYHTKLMSQRRVDLERDVAWDGVRWREGGVPSSTSDQHLGQRPAAVEVAGRVAAAVESILMHQIGNNVRRGGTRGAASRLRGFAAAAAAAAWGRRTTSTGSPRWRRSSGRGEGGAS